MMKEVFAPNEYTKMDSNNHQICNAYSENKEIFPDPPSEYTPATATENNLRDRVMELKAAHLQGNPTIEKGKPECISWFGVDVKADMYIRTQDEMS